MFKMYQATQSASYNSYKNTINVITPLYLKISQAIIVIFAIIAIFWIKNLYH
jgi:hypothetical protein